MLELILSAALIFVTFWIGVWMGRRSQTRTENPKGGSFVINTTDVNKDVIRMELDMPIAEMMNAKEVTFTVIREDEAGG